VEKMVVLYRQPEDVEAFEEAYARHIPLVEKVPGLVKATVTRFSRSLEGENFYLMAELFFPDKETFKSALRSPEMAAVGQDAHSFAAGLMTILLGSESGG